MVVSTESPLCTTQILHPTTGTLQSLRCSRRLPILSHPRIRSSGPRGVSPQTRRGIIRCSTTGVARLPGSTVHLVMPPLTVEVWHTVRTGSSGIMQTWLGLPTSRSSSGNKLRPVVFGTVGLMQHTIGSSGGSDRTWHSMLGERWWLYQMVWCTTGQDSGLTACTTLLTL